MNEQQLRHLLNQGTEVSPRAAQKLARARQQALEHQRPEPAPVVAWADNIVGHLGGWGGLALRVLLPVVLLLGAGAALYTWQQEKRVAELEEIDADLLTDELPIDAYLDRGFQNWLKKRAAER